MKKNSVFLKLSLFQCMLCWCFLFLGLTSIQAAPETIFNVKTFGAKGDSNTLDTQAINNTIEAAAKAGGGTVYFPAGTYLSFSIRLKSHISLYLDQGATILAATPSDKIGYDAPEKADNEIYQDFGHSHWQNSLIWGEHLEDISILGARNHSWQRII
jgi:polygalacturonase